MARNPARQTEVRYSACTFVQVQSPKAYVRRPQDVEQTHARGTVPPKGRGYGRRSRTKGSHAVTVLCRIEATSSHIELSVVQSLQHSPLDFVLSSIISAEV